MKYLYTLLFMPAFSYQVSAQTTGNGPQFPSQLRRVMANAAIEFKSLMGEKVKGDGANIIYASNLNLEGTTNNQVMSFSNIKSYSAKLGDAQDEKGAAALVEDWKSKISNIVGQSFEVLSYNHLKNKDEKIGYLLIWNKLSISIHAVRYQEDNNYNAFLVIMNL